nr:hypothetical protein [uncultured Rhodopila sp.]
MKQLAQYNRWADRRLYDDAASLPHEARRRPIGHFVHVLEGAHADIEAVSGRISRDARNQN